MRRDEQTERNTVCLQLLPSLTKINKQTSQVLYIISLIYLQCFSLHTILLPCQQKLKFLVLGNHVVNNSYLSPFSNSLCYWLYNEKYG